MKPEPFRIEIPDADLEDLRARLGTLRWADDFANDDWRYGVPRAYLRELVDHWRDRYDWRAHEAAMNAFAHYRVELDGIPIHFLHQRLVQTLHCRHDCHVNSFNFRL